MNKEGRRGEGEAKAGIRDKNGLEKKNPWACKEGQATLKGVISKVHAKGKAWGQIRELKGSSGHTQMRCFSCFRIKCCWFVWVFPFFYYNRILIELYTRREKGWEGNE